MSENNNENNSNNNNTQQKPSLITQSQIADVVFECFSQVVGINNERNEKETLKKEE